MFIPEFPGVSCTKEQKWSQKYFDVLKYARLGIFVNPASNSEGFDEKNGKSEQEGGGWVNDYGIARAWGDNAFWTF